MGNKTQKELEDERFLKLEQEMKELSDKADDLFGFKYLKEEKQGSKNLKTNWYEISLIILFIILGILSICLEWNFIAVILRISAIFFLSGFSSKSDVPIRHRRHFDYYLRFYKNKRLYTILILLTIVFIFVYGHFCDGLEGLFLLFLMPICGVIGLFLGHFITEIKIFVVKAIKGGVDWKFVGRNILNRVVAITIASVIVRIYAKYINND